MKKEQNMGRWVNCGYLLLVVLLLGLLMYLFFRENVVGISRAHFATRHITGAVYTELPDENAPLGFHREYTWTLEDLPQGDVCLAFYTVHHNVQVYLGEKLVYQLTSDPNNRLTHSPGNNFIIIPLYSTDANKTVRVVATPVYESVSRRKIEFYQGPSLFIYREALYQNALQIGLSALALGAGVVFCCIALFIYVASRQVNSLVYLGLFSIALGFWKLGDTRFSPLLFPQNPNALAVLSLAMLLLLPVPFLQFIRCQLGEKSRPARLLGVLAAGVSAAELVLVLLQLTGVAALRQTLEITHGLLAVSAVLGIFVVLYVWWHDKADSKVRLTLLCMMLCCASGLFDMMAYYINGHSSGLLDTLSVVLIFILVMGINAIYNLAEQGKQLKEQELELERARVSVMISQIQPHFLYNSLTTVMNLCDKDPKEAKAAVADFSSYLRTNLDSLTAAVPVPFARELEHCQAYLRLEKRRYGDWLNVVYDTPVEGFLIPPLTVQPLLENAIKHGLFPKNAPGTVTLATAETPLSYTITVTDDGLGFDPAVTPADGRPHLGIENVRSRLESLCGGTLDIRSWPGRGTSAVITLPK